MTKSKSVKRKHILGEDTIAMSTKAVRGDEMSSALNTDGHKVGRLGRHATLCLSSHLPVATQHGLLQHVQRLLEDMGQRFGKRWCLKELQQRGWTEPRSLELQCWVKFIRQHADRLPPTAPSLQPPPSEPGLFTKVANIRHLGVHRRSIDLPVMLQYLTAAEMFADLHQDARASAEVSRIKTRLQEIYDALTTRQDQLGADLQLQLQDIRVRQAALEQQAKTDTDLQNQHHLREAGTRVDELLCEGPPVDHPQPIWDDSAFSAPSDIDDILIEAAALMNIP